jgi:hypothetical protein
LLAGFNYILERGQATWPLEIKKEKKEIEYALDRRQDALLKDCRQTPE